MRPQGAGVEQGQGRGSWEGARPQWLALTLVVSMPRYLARTRGSWTVSRWVPLTVMAVLPLGAVGGGGLRLPPPLPSAWPWRVIKAAGEPRASSTWGTG